MIGKVRLKGEAAWRDVVPGSLTYQRVYVPLPQGNADGGTFIRFESWASGAPAVSAPAVFLVPWACVEGFMAVTPQQLEMSAPMADPPPAPVSIPHIDVVEIVPIGFRPTDDGEKN